MKKRSLVLAFASFSTLVMVGCGEGPSGDSTANNAILKAICPRGFDSVQDDALLTQALSENLGQDEIAVRKYITKFDTKNATEFVVSPESSLISRKSLSQISASDKFIVAKNCENLKATISGPGLNETDLDIKSININEITLTKTEGDSEITIKVERAGQTKIDVRENIQMKWRDKLAQKTATKKDLALGNTILTVSVDVKGPQPQSYVIKQFTGVLQGSKTIEIDSSVEALMVERAKDKGTAQSAIAEIKKTNDKKETVVQEAPSDLQKISTSAVAPVETKKLVLSEAQLLKLATQLGIESDVSPPAANPGQQGQGTSDGQQKAADQQGADKLVPQQPV